VGFTEIEAEQMVRGLKDANMIGADVVEAEPFSIQAEILPS
jgi:arginase family enzyme